MKPKPGEQHQQQCQQCGCWYLSQYIGQFAVLTPQGLICADGDFCRDNRIRLRKFDASRGHQPRLIRKHLV